VASVAQEGDGKMDMLIRTGIVVAATVLVLGPTAMLRSLFGRMMPDALEKLKQEAPRARGNRPG
jgi:hypothetical protein